MSFNGSCNWKKQLEKKRSMWWCDYRHLIGWLVQRAKAAYWIRRCLLCFSMSMLYDWIKSSECSYVLRYKASQGPSFSFRNTESSPSILLKYRCSSRQKRKVVWTEKLGVRLKLVRLSLKFKTSRADRSQDKWVQKSRLTTSFSLPALKDLVPRRETFGKYHVKKWEG